MVARKTHAEHFTNTTIQRRRRPEKLIAALRIRHAERLQVLLHGLHERDRPEEVRIHVASFGEPLMQPRLVEMAEAVGVIVLVAAMLVAIEALELRVLVRQRIDGSPKRVGAARARKVDEVHGP